MKFTFFKYWSPATYFWTKDSIDQVIEMRARNLGILKIFHVLLISLVVGMEYVLSLFHLCPLAIFVESRKLIEMYFDWSFFKKLAHVFNKSVTCFA